MFVSMEQLILAMRNSATLTREQIWYPDPPYIPCVRAGFSSLAWPGFVGTAWQAGGCLLVGSNGNSTEARASADQEYEDHDYEHAELIRAFRDAPNLTSFRRLMSFERADIVSWSLYSFIDKVMNRLDIEMEEVAILNVIPFSTQNAPHASSPAWKNSVALHLEPLFDILQPGRVVWLGKAAAQRVRPYCDHLLACPSHLVSRQRNLSWNERLKDIPILGAACV